MIELDRYVTTEALDLAELLRRGEATPAELAALAAEACARVNDRVGAVIELVPPEIGGAQGSPLAGVPFLLKDLGATAAGVRSELGSRLGAGLVAHEDTELMRRFRAAGLVLVGRSATSELGLLPVTETVLNGPTRSPWSRDHSAGGSSGGAAAAVAAGIVPLAHASDAGGSIRVPSACCGVVGLKPTRGRVSSAPHGADPVLGRGVELGIARSVRGIAALLDAAAGPTVGDPYRVAPPKRAFLDETRHEPERRRVAICATSWSSVAAHAENAAAARATGELLDALGHDVVERAPGVEWDEFMAVESVVWAATHARTVDALARATGRLPSEDTLEATSLALYEHGRRVSALELLEAVDGANEVGRRAMRLFADVDILVTPTLPGPPLELGAFAGPPGGTAREIVEAWARHESFTSLFNLTGQPAISLPLHRHESGLPLGIQLVGRTGDEASLLALAAQLEAAAPWHDRLPPVHATKP